MAERILIVDDDPVQRRLVEQALLRFGYEPVAAADGESALARLADHDARAVDLVLLDLSMPGLDGFAVLERLRQEGIEVPVVVQTANGSIDAVVSAMRAGAVDFVVKPVGPERLQVTVRNALKTQALEGELRRASRRASSALTFEDLVTRSDAMAAAIKLGQRAAQSAIPVLLEGETGTGKEVFARALATSGERGGKPFVAVNCGAIPAQLVESVLFGHEKGAFTGASEKHSGKFLEADGGTLFLDEVGELPLDVQVKLLRAIQENEIDPVGARRPVKVDIRIISATNKSLLDEVRAGRFREDLYYRLGVFPIGIPPLRHRREDIRALARRFLARFAAEERRAVRSISPAAFALLEQYDWPGNVRQLENAVFRAVVLAEGDELSVEHFPQVATLLGAHDLALPRMPLPGLAALEADAAPGASLLNLLDAAGHARTLEDIERETIRHALQRYEGQMTEVARRLGIGRSTLYRKLKELALSELCDLSHTQPPEAAA